MSPQFKEARLSKLRRYVAVAALGGGLIGALALAGWVGDVAVLKGILPGKVAMNPATAIAFILCGAALWLLRHDERQGVTMGVSDVHSRRVAVAQFLGSLALLLGVLKFSRYLLGWDAGVDQWFFPGKLDTAGPGELPNRMAPNTALNFVLISVALILLNYRSRRGRCPAQYFALATLVLSWMALIGYAYNTQALYGVGEYIPMAANTAVAFLLLASGILCARPRNGFMSVIVANETGGAMARRLLPVIVVVPVALGAARLKAQAAGWFDTEMGAALMVALTVILLVAVVWDSAARLNQADIERIRGEERIQELNRRLKTDADKLEEANKELEAFSYSVSHDLRAPLRHVSGFADLLRKEGSGVRTPAAERYLNVIAEATQQMGRLIDDLLDFSRNSRAEMRIRPVRTDVLIDGVIASLASEMEGRRICWNRQPLPEVNADAALLRQVWANLIANALKYTRPRPEVRIEIGCRKGERELLFFVRDNGVGFDMQYVDKLFGVFQRLHHSDEFEGTGIGLANVRRIVLRHGGRIWAEGVPDGGATFYFTLPEL